MAKVTKETKTDIIHNLAVENVVVPLAELMEELGYDDYSSKEGNATYQLYELKSIIKGNHKILFYEDRKSPNRRSVNTDKRFMFQIDYMRQSIKELREFSLELEAKIKELQEIPTLLTRKVLFEKTK